MPLPTNPSDPDSGDDPVYPNPDVPEEVPNGTDVETDDEDDTNQPG